MKTQRIDFGILTYIIMILIIIHILHNHRFRFTILSSLYVSVDINYIDFEIKNFIQTMYSSGCNTTVAVTLANRLSLTTSIHTSIHSKTQAFIQRTFDHWDDVFPNTSLYNQGQRYSTALVLSSNFDTVFDTSRLAAESWGWNPEKLR